MNGILIRSKAMRAAEGEKILKYFCNVEKQHFVSKQLFKLISKEGGTLTKNFFLNYEKPQERKQYYQTFYTEKEVDEMDLNTLVDFFCKK